MSDDKQTSSVLANRHYFVLSVIALLFLALMVRASYLQVFNQDFLLQEGSQRQLRTIDTPAYRGSIMDRFGTPVAISSPVDSVWANPQEALLDLAGLKKAAKSLNIPYSSVIEKLKQRANKEFVYLKRRVEPELAKRAVSDTQGIYLQREYSRFYPAGEVASHVLGFTDIDDIGREGLEYSYQDWLKATVGQRRILRNRKGQVVENISQVSAARPGKDLYTSLDMRLQYITYRSLAKTIKFHDAKSGSAVLLDAKTGEVLALANLPSYNPNNRKDQKKASNRRNRAITDVFEPGSTVKPFTLAAALERRLFNEKSKINTAPGYMKVTGHPIKDFSNYGVLDLAGILRKSSNVGATKVALSMPANELWQSFSDYGFGEPSGISFPAASSGYLSFHADWQKLDHATIAFGYGLSVSTLQLARAYSLFADGGLLKPVSLIKLEDAPQQTRVMKKSTAKKILHWMEQVVGPGGTARQAAITGYRVAGKTGTVKKSTAGGYLDDSYISVFAGVVPVSNPRLVMAVMVDEPQKNGYYGGRVAAPVFQEVLSHAVRLMNISPDDLPAIQQLAKSLEREV